MTAHSFGLHCHRLCRPEKHHDLSCLCLAILCFGVHGDGPHEAQQFPSERGHDLIPVLAAHGKRLVAFVQTMLRFPGHLFHFVAESQ